MDTVLGDYVVPLLQKELQVDPFGVCGVLIPLLNDFGAASGSSQQEINDTGLF